MRVIVTGATSFIGLSLCEVLLSNAHQVYAVCRENSPGLAKLPKNNLLKIIYSDSASIESLLVNVRTADIFINLAWAGTVHGERNDTDIQNKNVENTFRAISVAKELKCKLFVESGSQAEYGYIPGLIKETSVCNPVSEYGKAKLRVCSEGGKLCEQAGLKYLHLRIFSVFGENDHPWTLISSVLHKMMKNEDINLTSGLQSWNYLYVQDAAQQIYLLCQYVLQQDKYVSEIFHIASDDTRPLKSFIMEMYALTGSKSVLNYGGIQPASSVSLNPCMNKTREAIGFIADYNFGAAIKNIMISLGYKI